MLCVLSVHFVDSNTLYYQGLWTVWPVSGTVALIAGLTLNRTDFWAYFFSLRAFVWLGLLSYSWYLWHWPLLTIHKIYSLGGDTLTERIAVCSIALLAAYISYRYIERPVRERQPWLFATTNGTLRAGGWIILLMLGLSALVIANKVFLQLNPQHRLFEAAKDDVPDRKACDFQDKKYTALNVCGKFAKPPVQTRPVIVLWGDSHAEHFMPALAEIYPNHDIHELVFESCPPIVEATSFLLRNKQSCAVFNLDVMKHLKSLGSRLDGLYISARWPMYFGQYPILVGHVTEPADYPHQQMYQSIHSGLTDTLNQLASLSVKVSIIAPLPSLTNSAPKCIVRNPTSKCNISRSASDTFTNPSYLALQEIIKPHASMKLIDLHPYFCDALTCFASKNGRPIFTDDNHITATTARELASYLKP